MRSSGLRFSALLALGLLAGPCVRACTTAIVSGKATKDGRPILWKNRDAADRHNQVVRCEDGRYPYVGTVNGGDGGGLQIWSGVNGAGFAIMNNASYNLDIKGEDSTMEGTLMKLALQSCATVDDFQALLVRTDAGGRSVAANFGVIDARGGAAYFETDGRGFHRYDAAEAPGGFLVRGNYSHSGHAEGRTGLIREARAQDLVGHLQAEGRLSVETLLAEVARDTANAACGSFPARAAKGTAYIGDSISRQSTTNAFLVRGVRPGESPALATGWVILGSPAAGVAVPLWAGAAVPPELAAGAKPSPLGAQIERARAFLQLGPEDDRCKYLDAGRLFDPATGLAAPLLALERENLAEVDRALAKPGTDLGALAASLARRTLQGLTAELDARHVPSL
jgi:hypothetical protein